MALTVTSGLVDDLDLAQEERVVDMAPVITMLDPDVSQFTTMLMKVGRRTATSTKIQWLEDQLFPRLATCAGTETDSTTTIDVTTGEGSYFRAGDIVRVARTGEAFSVTSVSTDALTVVRGVGSVAAAALAASDQLLIVGNASAQGATLGTKKVLPRIPQYNYTQIQRNPYGFSKSLVASKLYGGSEPNKERNKKLTEHKRAIEYVLFWGARDLNTSGSEPIGYAGGLFEFISTNVKDAAGTLTKTLLDTYMRDLLQHGPQNHVLFVSPLVAQAISGFLRDAWQPNSTEARLWGAKVDFFLSGAYGGGKIPVVVKRDWNDFSSSSSQYGGWGFSVNMDNVKYAPLQTRDTALLRDRQTPSADAIEEEYLTEFSVEVAQEKTHGIIKGVTG